MIRSAVCCAVVLYSALLGVLLRECVFLAPLKFVIVKRYGLVLLWASLVLLANLFCVIHTVLRRFALEDTGKRLAHLEKQLRGGETISEELTARLMERE